MKIIAFNMGTLTMGLPLNVIECVEEIVEFRIVPNTPDYIPGYINRRGQLIPVLNPRIFFNIPTKPIELSDKLVIVDTHTFTIALWVDKVNGLEEIEDKDFINSDKFSYMDKVLDGVVKVKNGLVFISNPEHFLSKNELEKLNQTIQESGKILGN